MILEDDGSALTAAILCASIAMATSGIQMKDLPTACTVVSPHSAKNFDIKFCHNFYFLVL